MENCKYYPIDAYYSYQDKKLFYIVKKIDENGVVTKVTGIKEDPEITIKLAPFSKKIKYLLPLTEKTSELKIKYSHYSRIKKALASVYEGKKDAQKDYINKFPKLMTLKEDIYDDYKIETQFLQQEAFSYDKDYIKNINIGIWDIEIYHDDKEFPDPKEAKYPVNAICYYDLTNNDIYLFFLRNQKSHPESKILEEQILTKLKETYKDVSNFFVNIVEKEIVLLSNFLKFIFKTDVLVGWNSIDFDTLYLFNRCKKLNLTTAFEISFGNMYETMNIVDSKQGIMSYTHYTTNILSLDYIHLIKFYSMTNYPSYSLNRIAEKIIPKNADTISAKVVVPNLNFEYLKDPANFAIYNVGDVLLNKYIDDKLLFIKLLFKQKTMTRGFGASTLSVNNILDSYIALKCKEEGLMCISAVKVVNYYTKKIWSVYRRVNELTDDKLKLINELRETNKTFSLFSSVEELDNNNYDVLSEFSESDLEDVERVKLTKTQIPFIWDAVKYPGAYVKAPKKGIYLNVVDLDATSMYPTSIYTTNNAADTWIYQIPENVALKYIYEREDFIDYINNNEEFTMEIYDVINDVYKVFKHLEVLKVLDLIYKKELVLVETGAVFIPAHIKEGFFRKLITYPISERKRVRTEMKHLEESRGLTKDHPDIQNLNITQLVLKIIANCFSPDTEMITLDGIKNIKDVMVGDKVYNVNPETNLLEIDEVIETQEFDYNDYMYNFTNSQMLDLSVTDEHRFLVKDNKDENSWQFAKDVYSTSKYRIPKIEGVNIEDFGLAVNDYEAAMIKLCEYYIMVGVSDCYVVNKRVADNLVVSLTSFGYFIKYETDGTFYKISWFNEDIELDNRINKTKTLYTGKVYCVTTKNNKNVFAGRNGKFVTVGQSVYGYLGFRRSRLFNIILAGSITTNCQCMIRYVAHNCDDMIKEIDKKTAVD